MKTNHTFFAASVVSSLIAMTPAQSAEDDICNMLSRFNSLENNELLANPPVADGLKPCQVRSGLRTPPGGRANPQVGSLTLTCDLAACEGAQQTRTKELRIQFAQKIAQCVGHEGSEKFRMQSNWSSDGIGGRQIMKPWPNNYGNIRYISVGETHAGRCFISVLRK